MNTQSYYMAQNEENKSFSPLWEKVASLGGSKKLESAQACPTVIRPEPSNGGIAH